MTGNITDKKHVTMLITNTQCSERNVFFFSIFPGHLLLNTKKKKKKKKKDSPTYLPYFFWNRYRKQTIFFLGLKTVEEIRPEQMCFKVLFISLSWWRSFDMWWQLIPKASVHFYQSHQIACILPCTLQFKCKSMISWTYVFVEKYKSEFLQI